MTVQDPSHADSPTLCQLVLSVPQALEETLLDLLPSCPELSRGYSVLPAQGLGEGAVLRTVMEQVQGRARRVLVLALLPQAELSPLLHRLRTALPAPEVRYWVVPVLAEGRLA
jgi:hypothetical protein